MTDFRTWIRLCEALDVSTTKRAAEILIQNIDWSGGDGETLLAELGYFDEDGEERESEEPSLDDPAFRAEVTAWAEDRIDAAERNIEARFKSNLLPIYRMITAPADWKPDPSQHPGIYWSWDQRKADAHLGRFEAGYVKWMLYTEVTAEQIDWVSTLAANGEISTGDDEAEITLWDNQPVKILKYWRVGR